LEALVLRHHRLVCTVAALICGIAPFAVDAQESLTDHATEQAAPRFTRLDIFGSDVLFVSINNRRMVTGTYVRIDGPEQDRLVGFALLDRFLHPVDFENAHNVSLTGLNDRGEIVGLLSRTDSLGIAFRYSRGELEAIDVTDSTLPPAPHDINNRGDIVGRAQINFREHGYLLSGDQLTLLDPPDAVPRFSGATAYGINDRRDIVGCYSPANAPFSGFLFRKEAYTRLQVLDARETCAFDINNRGQIVGYYLDAVGRRHGFLLWNGRYVTIDIPNSFNTDVTSINDFGDIVGIYSILTPSFEQRAFKSNIREFVPRRNVQR
jgi:probable HAF family extracellular repeat protein